MRLVASLPWYDHPASAAQLDSFWLTMRRHLLSAGMASAPLALNRSMPLEEQWKDSGLVLSQCCGPDLFTDPAETVACLGRPAFSDLDCPPGFYYSHIVSRGDVVADPVLAINSPTSWSGNMALRRWLRERDTGYSSLIVSGSHQNSLQLLRAGQADLIAVDAHTWTLLDTEGVTPIGRSELALTPPYITGLQSRLAREQVHDALRRSIESDGSSIGVCGLLSATKSLYASAGAGDGLSAMRREAAADSPA